MEEGLGLRLRISVDDSYVLMVASIWRIWPLIFHKDMVLFS
jgi:hypothetical protein